VARFAAGLASGSVQYGLGEFEIPVAVFVPGELVHRLGGLVEAVTFDRLGDCALRDLQARQYPAVCQGTLQGLVTLITGQGAVLALGVHQHEARRVPELVAEIAVPLNASSAELDIAAGRRERREGESHCIGAEGWDALGEVLARQLFDPCGQLRLHHAAGAFCDQALQVDAVDHVDGVEHVALRLRHLLTFGIADQAVDVDLVERHLVHELQPHHDHPGDPEEDDVEAGDQHVGRIELAQAIGLIGPAECREGPQRGAEPGVEYVFVLAQRVIG
jgi:hypothetical protein